VGDRVVAPERKVEALMSKVLIDQLNHQVQQQDLAIKAILERLLKTPSKWTQADVDKVLAILTAAP